MDSSGEHGKIFGVVLGLIILAFFFLYLQKSGQLDEIRQSFRAMSGHSSASD